MRRIRKSSRMIHGLTGLLFSMISGFSHAQPEVVVGGTVTDASGEPMPYVNIAIRELPDSLLIGGTISDEKGTFIFRQRMPGRLLLTASFVGYEPGEVLIDASDGVKVNTGAIVLKQQLTALQEAVIRKNRKKAKQQVDRTTYYVNNRMRSTSRTGVDLLNKVPGVRIDLRNAISLDGSSRIVIMVNGVRRDADYLAQIAVDQIDRVEILSSGGMRHGSGVTGVIRVILREEDQRGISGHVTGTLPTRFDEVFSFPSASLTYSSERNTLYTSYNGGFSCFIIEGMNRRVGVSEADPQEMVRTSRLNQENWSHKVHFGMDRFSDEKNQFSLYGFASTFSNEQDGRFHISRTQGITAPSELSFNKEDSDWNRSAFGSVYYRHLFRPGTEFVFEASYYLLRSGTGTVLTPAEGGIPLSSLSEPGRDEALLRARLSRDVGKRIVLETGLQQGFHSMRDDLIPLFGYIEQVSAVYLQGRYNGGRFQANAGLRAEYNRVTFNDMPDQRRLFLLPQVDLKYALNRKNNLKFSYEKQVNRPDIHQLIPSDNVVDPFMLQRGNPGLLPEITREVSVMYSLSFRENFLSAGLFCKQEKGIIEELTTLRSDGSFLRMKQNLGDLRVAGVKTLGSINLNDQFSIQSHLEVSGVQTHCTLLAREAGVSDRTAIQFKGKVSAVWEIIDKLLLSASLQGQSSTIGIQHRYREGALYFINLEKIFFDRLKLGVTSAIPWMRSFTYQGHELSGKGFVETSEDQIVMSAIPIWFKMHYSFTSGKSTRRLERDRVFEESRVKKGF